MSYSAALSEADLLFPEVGKGEGTPQGDTICGAARRQVVLGTGEKSLKEVVLVVLCSKMLEEEEHYGVIDSLMREDFRLINLRQTWLSTKQATELAGALGLRYPFVSLPPMRLTLVPAHAAGLPLVHKLLLQVLRQVARRRRTQRPLPPHCHGTGQRRLPSAGFCGRTLSAKGGGAGGKTPREEDGSGRKVPKREAWWLSVSA